MFFSLFSGWSPQLGPWLWRLPEGWRSMLEWETSQRLVGKISSCSPQTERSVCVYLLYVLLLVVFVWNLCGLDDCYLFLCGGLYWYRGENYSVDMKIQWSVLCYCVWGALDTLALYSVGPASLKYLIRLMSVINPGDLVPLFSPPPLITIFFLFSIWEKWLH